MTANTDSPGAHLVNRKLDLLAKELRRHGVAVAAIQETKWFGSDVWQAGGYTLLHSGHPLPSDDEPAVRNEGVGIMLDERATTAWKEAGEVWEAVSSRVVTARLRTTREGQRRPGGPKETRNTYVSVISAYADIFDDSVLDFIIDADNVSKADTGSTLPSQIAAFTQVLAESSRFGNRVTDAQELVKAKSFKGVCTQEYF